VTISPRCSVCPSARKAGHEHPVHGEIPGTRDWPAALCRTGPEPEQRVPRVHHIWRGPVQPRRAAHGRRTGEHRPVKIAIIGSGIAGNVAAAKLHRDHEITVFEAGSHVGGHTHTHTVEHEGRTVNVDTGFIVFNDWTYPQFIALLEDLGVATQESSM